MRPRLRHRFLPANPQDERRAMMGRQDGWRTTTPLCNDYEVWYGNSPQLFSTQPLHAPFKLWESAVEIALFRRCLQEMQGLRRRRRKIILVELGECRLRPRINTIEHRIANIADSGYGIFRDANPAYFQTHAIGYLEKENREQRDQSDVLHRPSSSLRRKLFS
eukprot:scaffold6849_cov157-Skeletonema_marinoi.AAC.9